MTMQSTQFNEQEGSVHYDNRIRKTLTAMQPLPWWSSISMEETSSGNQHGFITFQGQDTLLGMDKGGQKTHFQSVVPDYRSRFELGFAQPMARGKYPYGDQHYGVLSASGSQAKGRFMLPLSLTSGYGPVYVNAKQYHAIIRRRQRRAKEEFLMKMTKARKPYMHESRHLHALRRPRGCGGRFLNKKNLKSENEGLQAINNDGEGQLSYGHQSSGILQSDSGSLSPKDTNGTGPNLSGSEVTSMYSREYIDNFSMNHLRFNRKLETGHGIVMPSKWVAAAGNNCCNLDI